MDEELLIRRKILDTANKSYNQGIYTFTNFLNINELSVYNTMKKELSFIPSESFGGHSSCERQIIRFGNNDFLGYNCDYPIKLIRITPISHKYADKLTHRDYLGALMNLGIERNLLGDIIIQNKCTYLFCMEHIADFITNNLFTVKHTNMRVEICDASDSELINSFSTLQPLEIISASSRIDAVTASITKLSRSSVIELFKARKIFVNGIVCENHSAQLKNKNILVIRGYGKYIYEGEGKTTKSGRIYVKLMHYV